MSSIMNAAWVIFAAEFTERFAYYGSVFIIPTFITVVMGGSQSEANIVLNVIFTASPLMSILACFPADSPSCGKTRVLIAGCILYGLGLLLFTLSSLPELFSTFPGSPSHTAWFALLAGIIALSIGYGLYKAVTAPLIADSFEKAKLADSQKSSRFALYAWIINLGGLCGTLISPFLRRLSNDRTADPSDSSSSVTVAYYYSFGCCTILSLVGLTIIAVKYRTLLAVEPAAEIFEKSSLITTCKSFFSTSGTAERLQFIRSCATFVPLPFFWLIQNQFASNVMFQLQWSDMPSDLPQEFFNNINTIALLVTIIVLQYFFGCCHRIPSQRSRMLLGFSLVAVAMIYCAVVQIIIDRRGYFDKAGDYYLRPYNTRVSAAIFVPVYLVSGISSALIDPTTLEAAFGLAPHRFKSLVMCVYLVAASLSGALGLAFAPLAAPATLTLMYGIMAWLLAIVSLGWRLIPLPELDADIFLCSQEENSL